MSPHDTIAAIATPLGEGGLGVVRVSGGRALAVADAIFRSRRGERLAEQRPNTCHVGLVGDPPIDHVVATVFRAPHSYTGEDTVELSSHGSPVVLQEILRASLKAGARLAEPGEFTQRAFLAGKLDLTQAEAVADLIHAKTEKARAAAFGQLQGRLSDQVRALRDRLLPLLAHVEVGLDHSDEEHSFLDRQVLLERCGTVRESIAEILRSERVGKILRNGFRVALIGRPNVGKSSLMNALLREDRAIVTPIAGTTRDTLAEPVNWDGIPVVLTDTAGMRNATEDPVERLGIARSEQALQNADVVIALFDASEPLTEEDDRVARAAASKPRLIVRNKSDLAPAWERASLTSRVGGDAVIDVSAKTGEGLDRLIESVKKASLRGEARAGDAEWLLNARHRDALERAQTALTGAVEAAAGNAYEECVALELKTALGALGEIIGETATEELLGQIFSQFCVGK